MTKSLPSNQNNLFSNIAATVKSYQSGRATLKAFSYILHMLYLPFSDVRQHYIQELGINIIVFKESKSVHVNPFINKTHQILNTFRLSKIVL